MIGNFIWLFLSLGAFTDSPAMEQQNPLADSVIVENLMPGNPSLNQSDAQGRRQGLWVTYHANNMVESMGYFVDSLRDGTFIFIDERGWVIAEENYKMGIFHGSQRYYSIGTLVKLAMYVDGELDGIYETYHRNRIIAERHFYEKGKKHGMSVWFSEKGQPSFEYTYQHGEIHGEVKSYYPSGAIKTLTIYKNNEMDGGYYEYHEVGTMALSGQYKKGKKTGEWITYNEMGDPIKKEKIK
jgi:antitoxin component YwqK of YwqJK toxin-antitoxin module